MSVRVFVYLCFFAGFNNIDTQTSIASKQFFVVAFLVSILPANMTQSMPRIEKNVCM